MGLLAVKHLDPVVGIDVHSVLVAPSPTPMFLPHPHVGFMLDLREYIEAAKGVVGSIAMAIAQEKAAEYLEDHPDVAKKLDDAAEFASGKLTDIEENSIVAEGLKLEQQAAALQSRIGNMFGAGVGMGGAAGRPIFVNGLMRATAGTHSYHVPGLHFPLGESFAPPPEPDPIPSDDAESYMGSRTVLANNDPMSFMALPALSCWSIGLEPPGHNSAHTDRTYPSMPSSVMLPIPAGRPVMVGGPPVLNMAAAAKGLFKAFQGSKWAKSLADKLNLKPGFLRCKVLHAEPVNAITGEVILQQHDFTVAGRLPLEWNRYYASHDERRGAIGAGWRTPADIHLELMRYEGAMRVVAEFHDSATAFDSVPDAAGWSERIYDRQHGHALYRRDNRLVLRTRAAIEYEFVLPEPWQYMSAMVTTEPALTLAVERIADLNGNAWVFERVRDGSVARLMEWNVDGPTGRMIQCDERANHSAGNSESLLAVLTLIDADTRAHPLVRYEHDHDGNLIAALDAMSQPHRFVYADCHRMVRHTSAAGLSFHYRHCRHDDGVWRVDHAWGDNGLFDYRFVYDVGHRATRITDSLGYATTLQANERGLPVASVDPLGGITSYRYDAYGRTIAETDAAGCVTTWRFDTDGSPLEQTLADGSTVRAAYDENRQLVHVSTPGGRQWHYVWDERGNLLQHDAPARAGFRYEYDRYGQLIAHRDSGGTKMHFDYDRDGNLAEVLDALGNRTRYIHDARANMTGIVNAFGQASHYEYDRNGNLTRAVEPGERETTCCYDAVGNLTRYRDPNGEVTQLEYTALGQVARRLKPDGSVIEFRYDTEEQLTDVVNERGEWYRLKRDALGRIVEEVDYWGQSRRYEYTATNDLRRSIDPLGRVIDYETDPLGRIVRKRVPDPRQPEGTRIETFVYDCAGNMMVAENPDSRVELTYDPAGRVVEEKQGARFVIVNAYDEAGHRISCGTRLDTGRNVVSHVVRHEYDLLGGIRSIRIDDAEAMTFERDAVGQICVEHLKGDLRRDLSYTSEGLLEKQVLFAGAGPLFVNEYAYDANGYVLEKRDSRFGIGRYQHDPVGNLTQHLDPVGNLHRFLYDATGDLLKTRVSQGKHADVRRAGEQTDTWSREGEYGGCRYTFDRAGNLVRKVSSQQDLSLLWDGDGLLIETVSLHPAPCGSHNGQVAVRTWYAYDVFHRRTGKRTWRSAHFERTAVPAFDDAQACHESSFFWDDNALAVELSTVEASSVSSDDEKASQYFRTPNLLTDITRQFIYYPETVRPLAMVCDASEVYFFHNDTNGAPVRVTDAKGLIVWDACFEPWGTRSDRAEHADILDIPIRFQGQYHDEETGFDYNRYRYYDPAHGSFITQDPVGLAGGPNLYRYAPETSRWSDPLGLAKSIDPFFILPDREDEWTTGLLYFTRPLPGNGIALVSGTERHKSGQTAEGRLYQQTANRLGAQARGAWTHVEPKAAMELAAHASKVGVLYMNNKDGPCPNCQRATPLFLPGGKILYVRYADTYGHFHGGRKGFERGFVFKGSPCELCD
ncbi:RHS repeat-associated core domain-containing protein [Burkholderia ambifaria]|uniref:RHS repeat-associated core domain-containing protein n=1 Tax=Burkholderia ambifaria TaxID=152480 RepID=UPI001B9254D3|nr:RHS repeat-associated core domain-containing protein [Burkholderia ambifaria]MBR8253041.1 RHS domain-containing protein [Burkholderia ambifaria]